MTKQLTALRGKAALAGAVMAAAAAAVINFSACSKDEDDNVYSVPDNTQEADLKTLITDANKELVDALQYTIARKTTYTSTATGSNAYTYISESRAQYDVSNKKMSSTSTMTYSGVSRLESVRVVEEDNRYQYNLEYSGNDIDYLNNFKNNTNPQTEKCYRTLSNPAEYYDAYTSGSGGYIDISSTSYTWTIAAAGGKVKITRTYSGSSASSDKNEYEVTLDKEKKYKHVKLVSESSVREVDFAWSASPDFPSEHPKSSFTTQCSDY